MLGGGDPTLFTNTFICESIFQMSSIIIHVSLQITSRKLKGYGSLGTILHHNTMKDISNASMWMKMRPTQCRILRCLGITIINSMV